MDIYTFIKSYQQFKIMWVHKRSQSVYFILCVVVLQQSVVSFQGIAKLTLLRKCHTGNSLKDAKRFHSPVTLSMVIEIENTKSSPVLSAGELLTPPSIDRPTVTIFLIGQYIVTFIAFVFGLISNIDIVNFSTWSLSADSFGLAITYSVIIVGKSFCL